MCDAALACVPPTRVAAGNDMYVLHRDAQDASLLVFVEHWKSQQGLDQHMQKPHFKTLSWGLPFNLPRPSS